MSKEHILSLVSEIRALGTLVDCEGEDVELEERPAPDNDALDAFREVCGGRIPDDLATFLSVTGGFRGVLEFEPEPMTIERGFEGLLRGSDYGNGDGFALEPSKERCRVWWAGHDPYYLVFWAHSIEGFLHEFLDRARRRKDDYVDVFHDWSPVSESQPVGSTDAGSDEELKAFFESVPPGTWVHDLREAAPGTEIPFECLDRLIHSGELKREGLLLAYLPPPSPTTVEPVPVKRYLSGDLQENERRLLASLPKGSLVLHKKDMPPGGRIDIDDYPDRDVSWRPPFHIVLPPRKPWWRFW